MNPDLARNLVACRIEAPYLACRIEAPYLDASRLSSSSMIASTISTCRQREPGQMLIPPGLVQQASAAAFWDRLISAFFAVVDPEALPLES